MDYRLAYCFFLVNLGTIGAQKTSDFLSSGPRPIHKETQRGNYPEKGPSQEPPADSSPEINSPQIAGNKETPGQVPGIPKSATDIEEFPYPSISISTESPTSSTTTPQAPNVSPATLDSFPFPNDLIKEKTGDVINSKPIIDGQKLGISDHSHETIPNSLIISKEAPNKTGSSTLINDPTSFRPTLKESPSAPVPQQADSTMDQTKKTDPNVPFSTSKPPGIFVETVNTNVFRDGPVRIGSRAPCPTETFEDKDIHKLSNSQFGYPKSIVSKALSESIAEPMLKILEDQHYLSIVREEKTGSRPTAETASTSTPRNDLLKIGFAGRADNQFPPIRQGFPESQPFNSLFPDSRPNTDSKFGNQANPFNSIDPAVGEQYKATLATSPGIQSNSALNFPFNAQSETGNASPHLLKDSAFQNQLFQNPVGQGAFDDLNSQNKDLLDDLAANPATIIQGATTEGNLKRTFLEPEEGQSFGTNIYSNQLPDVSSENPQWFSRGLYPARFGSSESQNPTSYNSDMERLFPPKSSDSFGGSHGDSFIKYSPDRSSSVSSPFQLDTKSLFSSISGVSVGIDSSSPNRQSPKTDVSAFGSKSPLFSSAGAAPSQDGNAGTFAGNFQNNRFGASFGKRRKREARATPTPWESSAVRSTCPTSHKLLRQYQNHGGPCYVVKPEVQSIQYASCTNSRCRGCHVDNGDSRCLAVRMPMWVWSYCEQGPNGGKVTADRVTVSVACTCQMSTCQR